MLELFSQKKPLSQQTPADKMALLKVLATRALGSKWEYFRKIKHAGEKFEFLKEQSLMEQMKATQAALKFTAKNTRKTYWNVYKETIATVKRDTGLKNLPDLPEIPEGQDVPTLKPMHDGLIVQWCPEVYDSREIHTGERHCHAAAFRGAFGQVDLQGGGLLC